MQKIVRASALALVILLAACGGNPTTPPTLAPPVATAPAAVAKPTLADQPAPTSVPATKAASPTKSVPTPNVTSAADPSNNADGAGGGQLGTLGAGLDKLKSYSTSWTLAYDTKDDKGAAEYLANKIRKGGSGVWGAVPMPANNQVSEADAKKLAAWVLATP